MATAPLVMLYDGSCRFCTASAKGLARRGRGVVTKNFQDEGALAGTGVTWEAAMKRIHVLEAGGTIHAGAGAVARVLRTVPWLAPFTYLYYVPGIRQLSELLYDVIAANRYKLFGRTESCDGGTCHLH